MNQKNIAIIAVLAAVLLAGIFTSTSLAFADESQTNTEQAIKQENVGSGESTNFNCGENSIDGGFLDARLCGTADLELGDTDSGQGFEICFNNVDDDGDGAIDEQDCWVRPS